jgi:putative colanic acid biosynthesis UDP-glucose lipid carrier transferase
VTSIIGTSELGLDAFRFVGRVQQYGAILVRLAFLLDCGVLYCALYIAVSLLGIGWGQRYVTLALLSIVVFSLVTSLKALDRWWRLERFGKELAHICGLVTISFVILAALLAVGTQWGHDASHLRMLAVWWALSLLGIFCARSVLRLLLLFWRAGSREHRRVALYGATKAAQRLEQVFRQHSWVGIDVVGLYDDQPADRRNDIGLEIIGDLQALVRRAEAGQLSAVYITTPLATEAGLQEIIDRFADTTISLHYCPALFDLNLLGAHWDDVFGLPVISVINSPLDGFRRHVKRLEDVLLTLLILPLVALPALAIVIAMTLTSPGPILFSQTRSGLDGRRFKIYKFRTMYTLDSDEEFVQAKRNDARITPLGAFLRRTSLDELPQFINVLAGDMSIVGPRPAPVKYNEEHRQIIYRYMLRHKVKPGMTGLAQVRGCRGETETLDKAERRTAYDLQYINNWSLHLDLLIILRTIGLVFEGLPAR